METRTKILIIDDNKDDRFFFKGSILDSEINANVITTQNGMSDGIEAAQDSMDCIFLNFHLPQINGLEILKKIRSMGIDTPVIMLTEQKDEPYIVKLKQAGATDCIPKSSLTSETLRQSYENSIHIHRLRKEKEVAEAALKECTSLLKEAQQNAGIGNWEYDITTKEIFLSEEAREILGYPIEKSIFPYVDFIRHHVYQPNIGSLISFIRNLQNNLSSDITLRIKTYENAYKYINIKKRTIEDLYKMPNKIKGTIQDITALKKSIEDTRRAKISKRATTFVLTIGVCIFLVSEAIVDPFIDVLQMGVLIALSIKGIIALLLKPLETITEKMMLKGASIK
jgi:CheY-like chemotaxis protein